MPDETAACRSFDALRREWQGRIEMQAVALMSIERVDEGRRLCRALPASPLKAMNGVLGAFIAPRTATLNASDALFPVRRGTPGLDVDSMSTRRSTRQAQALELILRTACCGLGFSGTVVAGHCCSLSTMPTSDRDLHHRQRWRRRACMSSRFP